VHGCRSAGKFKGCNGQWERPNDDQVGIGPETRGTEPASLSARHREDRGDHLGEIAKALSSGDRVELRGFGAFSVKSRPARTGRNPRTGETVTVGAKHVPFFKTGKELRERLNLPKA